MTNPIKPARNQRKAPKKSTLAPVLVKWEDALFDSDFEDEPSKAGETQICIGIGFLVKEDEKIIVLAGEKNEEGTLLRWVLTIPRALVREITFLEPKI